MNNKKTYEEAKIEVIPFACDDIITTSIELFWEDDEDYRKDIRLPEQTL